MQAKSNHQKPAATHRPVITLSLIVPVFNEQDNIATFIASASDFFSDRQDLGVEMLFVNDGSDDSSLATLLDYQTRDSRIQIIDLSRRFGKEAALTAGLDACLGEIAIAIDADLQHPINIIEAMIEQWKDGNEVVIGRRTNRQTDDYFKRIFAISFYRIHNIISRTRLEHEAGDFRLMDRVVINAINSLPESNRLMKGLFAWAGFKTVYVDYEHGERHAGTSKFKRWELWNFALDAVTGFSTLPLRIWTYLGIFLSLLSIVYAGVLVFSAFVWGKDVSGYPSVMVGMTLLGGIQLMGIGVLGEYLGRTYQESKRRPTYLVRKHYRAPDDEKQHA
jgi:glycosyltransferase involved in cell wall biosynthesis